MVKALPGEYGTLSRSPNRIPLMSPLVPKSILYAEDDENDVFFMQRAFRKLNLPIALQVVPNGRVAVEYLSGVGAFADRAKHPLPEIVLLDVKMPEMSGLEVLKWARDQSEFKSLPILLFTSSTQRTDIDFSRKHRASGYLVKPSNAEHLAVLVDRILKACAGRSAESEILDVEENQMGKN
jgi:CheY-like chemotaxis protein